MLVFVPLITAHDWHKPPAARLAVFFLALCFAASAVYLINDLCDLDSDRRHADKRMRPLASGELPIPYAFIATVLCLALSLLACAFIGATAAYLTCGYVIATTAYSLYLKRVVIIDMIMLSGFYVFRIVAGAIIAPESHSPWLAVFSMFLFVSLAAAKRYSEMASMPDGSAVNSGRGYILDDQPMIAAAGISSGCLAVLVLGLYVNSDIFRSLYSHAPNLFWAMCPILLYWILRIWFMAGRRLLREDPVMFAVTDGVTWLVVALGLLTFWIAT